MTDKFPKETRSKIMKSIRSVSSLEERIRKELWNKGIRYRKNSKKLFGKPDITIKKYKLVIFIDSCFWHGCIIHGHIPKSNHEYWIPKLLRNMKRDEKVTQYYIENRWNIIRLWEHEFKEDFTVTIQKIINFIEKAKC